MDEGVCVHEWLAAPIISLGIANILGQVFKFHDLCFLDGEFGKSRGTVCSISLHISL